MDQSYSQETRAEHEDDLNLLLQIEGQVHQRSDREADDRQVHSDLHRSLVPRIRIDVDAIATVLTIPT